VVPNQRAGMNGSCAVLLCEPPACYNARDERKRGRKRASMPVVYETTAQVAENGRLQFELEGLPFEAGTRLAVKLIPEQPFDAKLFERRMQALLDECAGAKGSAGMTKAQVLAELRRQREERYPGHASG